MVILIDERIKELRNKNGLTQKQLAKRVGVTRTTINSWEMAISAPSCNYLAELSKTFGVSADYLLNLDDGIKIDISDLSDREQELVMQLVDHFRSLKE